MVDNNPKNYSSLSYNIYRRNYGEKDRMAAPHRRQSEFRFHELGQILVGPGAAMAAGRGRNHLHLQ